MLRNRLNSVRRAPKGLTLIELIVVLTIMVALGGLIAPIIANSLTRSHVATCSYNIPEIAKTLMLRDALEGDYGDNWSTGVANTGATNSVNGADIGTLTADEVAALAEAGITTVFDHGDPAATGYNVTFSPGLTTETIAATTTQFIVIDAVTNAYAIDQLTLDPAGKYVWLGMDVTWTGVGDTIPEAPVHFGDAEGALPHQVYSRFGGVFQVADASGALGRAKLARVSYNLEGTAFETADNHIAIHWQEVHGN